MPPNNLSRSSISYFGLVTSLCHFIFLYSSLPWNFLDKVFLLRIYHFWHKLFCNQPQTSLAYVSSCQGWVIVFQGLSVSGFLGPRVSLQGRRAHWTQGEQPWGAVCRDGQKGHGFAIQVLCPPRVSPSHVEPKEASEGEDLEETGVTERAVLDGDSHPRKQHNDGRYSNHFHGSTVCSGSSPPVCNSYK